MKVHIHENFGNYGVLQTMAVKFVHYCYHSSNWNLDDFSNQGCMFASMGYDWAFENCLKHGLVHGGIPWKKAKLDSHCASAFCVADSLFSDILWICKIWLVAENISSHLSCITQKKIKAFRSNKLTMPFTSQLPFFWFFRNWNQQIKVSSLRSAL